MLKALPQEPPFAEQDQLCTDLDGPANPAAATGRRGPRLPGYPRVSLARDADVLAFLEAEHCSPDLDRAAPRLWWLSTQDSGNVSPLHRQRVKGRDVVVTEEAGLHLVWLRDRIFVKPLPGYLASHVFWRRYLSGGGDVADPERRDRVRKAALGFLRTYLHLIRYESDFHVAQEARLVPQAWTWEAFADFAEALARVSDGDVSARYAYGELRLARLNLYAPLLLGKARFQRVEHHRDAAAYVARFYGPVLSVIGVASVVLSGLQVAVAVEEEAVALQAAALWFSVLVMLGSCAVVVVLVAMVAWKVGMEWKYALRNHERRPEEGRPLAGASKT